MSEKQIDFTKIDILEIENEIIEAFKNTGIFNSYDFKGAFITQLVQLLAFQAKPQLFYINSSITELTPQARLYESLSRLNETLGGNGQGIRSETLNLVLELLPDYFIGKQGNVITIPKGTKFNAKDTNPQGDSVTFTLTDDIIHRVKSFGIKPITNVDIFYDGVPFDVESFSSTTIDKEKFSISPVSDLSPLTLRPDTSTEVIVTSLAQANSGSLPVGGGQEYFIQIADATTSTPRLEISTTSTSYDIAKIKKESGNLIISEVFSADKFFIGFAGIENFHLDTETRLEISVEDLSTTNKYVTQFKLFTGSNVYKPMRVLIDGIEHTLPINTFIESQEFTREFFLKGVALNIKLKTLDSGKYELVVNNEKPDTGEVTFAVIGSDSVVGDVNSEFGDILYNIANAEITNLTYTHINETIAINNLKEGETLRTSILDSGLVDTSIDNLNGNLKVNKVYELELDGISYSDVRIFVTEDGKTKEWNEILNKFNEDVTDNTEGFFITVNEKRNIEISFIGKDPLGAFIDVDGIETLGLNGRVGANVIENVIVTPNFFEDDQLIPILYNVKQTESSFGGRDAETKAEIRKALSIGFKIQNRTINNHDYKDFILSRFGDIVVDVNALNYDQVNQNSLIENIDKFFFNNMFLYVVPRNGMDLTLVQRNHILDTVNEEFNTTPFELVANTVNTIHHTIQIATFVNVGFNISYTQSFEKPSLSTSIQENITKRLTDFFDRDIQEIGATLNSKELRAIIENDTLIDTANFTFIIDGVEQPERTPNIHLSIAQFPILGNVNITETE